MIIYICIYLLIYLFARLFRMLFGPQQTTTLETTEGFNIYAAQSSSQEYYS